MDNNFMEWFQGTVKKRTKVVNGFKTERPLILSAMDFLSTAASLNRTLASKILNQKG
jgi:hypothetical protein